MYRDKARAETLDARIVLIATRLVDRPFAAEFGFNRHDGKANLAQARYQVIQLRDTLQTQKEQLNELLGAI